MRTRDDKTRLSYWFPRIEAAGLPVPRTYIIHARGLLDDFADGKEPACLASLDAEIRIAASSIGVPFFLRTDYTSAKHGWTRTCFVSDASKLRKHIYEIWEFSEMADLFGLPTDVWVVREVLRTKPAFRAFWGGMPITREFRYFVRDGEIEHRQPYWPPDAIEVPDGEDWRGAMDALNDLDPTTDAALTALSKQASAAVEGFWSVDWLLTVDRGWVLTDMAEGEKSYRWSPARAEVSA